ncbi:MAG: RIP metalloprotease RseP, partial [Candidatus Hydrogenedentota bacterium]
FSELNLEFSMLFNIAVFLLVLGVLVFVHELGHFLAAKACGVYVDRFSLGMPPRIFGIRWGQTDYCIGLLPIGGYVKMAGQEDAPLSDDEREETYGHVPPEQWFNNKTKLQRAFILIAGPAMNMVLAFFIYLGIGTFGANVPAIMLETRIGEVAPDSPAASAPMYAVANGLVDLTKELDSTGWRVGDRILTVNRTEMTGFQDIITSAVLSEGDESSVEIERTQKDGTVQRYISRIASERLSPDEKMARYGIQIFQSALIEHVLPGSPAEQNGLQAKDRIHRVNGELIDSGSFRTTIQALESDETLNLEVERDGEIIELGLTTKTDGMFEGISFTQPLGSVVSIQNAEPQPILLENESFSQRTQLKTGELVSAVNGQEDIGTQLRLLMEEDPEAEVGITVLPAPSWFSRKAGNERKLTVSVIDIVYGLTNTDNSKTLKIRALTPEFAETSGLKRKDTITHIDGQEATVALMEEIRSNRIGETIPIKVHRPSVLFGFYQKESTFDAELTVDSVQRVGVVWAQETIFHKQKPADIIPYAFGECIRRSTEIGKILGKLVTGGISPKLLGGPVLIYEMTTASARMSFYQLLTMVALISVNLCIFNLLPLPVLDGGQLTIIAIEAIRRRPVSTRILENVQQAGFIFILGLLVFVTFNDVSRIFERWLP